MFSSNIYLLCYFYSMLVNNMFASPRELQNSVLLLESVQPKDLKTYWKVYVYSKAIKACLLSLEHVKHPDTLTELATEVSG